MEEIPGFFLPAVVTLAVLLLALVIRTKVSRTRRPRLPPGPQGWPIIGSLPSLGMSPHESLYNLSKQYGPLMFMYLGSVKTLVVTSSQMAEEVLKTHDQFMASRPQMIAVDGLTPAGSIFFSPYGQHWRYLRKVCTAGLLTINRINQFKEVRQLEVLANLHFILEESERGNAVNMAECLANLTVNNITQMMMNKSICIRRSSSTAAPPKLTPIQETVKEMVMLVGEPNIADFVPLLKPFDPQGFNKRIKDLYRRWNEYFDGIIDEHRQRQSTATPESYADDFVDALLGFGKTNEFQEQLSMESVKAVLMDMLFGAGDTSSTTLQWALSELIKHPHVMRRAQEELDSVVGTKRLVQEEDLPELKYLEAVIKETLRLHTITPIMVPHESTDDCEIQGFHVPAKTRVIVNLWAIHRDPAQWERPLEFNPDRFLNSPIDFKGKDFRFMPFGSGRRMCPGNNLGILMTMYPLATMLHALDWTLPEGQKPEELDTSDAFGIFLYKRLPLIAFGKPRLSNHVIYPARQEFLL